MRGYFLTLFAIIISFLAPIKGLMLLMMAFVLLDTITGIYSSIKVNGKESFKSAKLFNLAPKVFIYLSAIILAYGVDELIINGLFNIEFILAKILTSVFIYTEIKSIDENSMRLGNRSVWTIMREFITRAKTLKKDISES